MSNTPVLTLAFSCLGERYEKLVEMIDSLSLTNEFEIIIVIQKPVDDTPIMGRAFRTIVLNNIGLSNSRNAALENAIGEYVWLLDDDIVIEQKKLYELLGIIKQSKTSDFYRVQINCLEDSNSLFKNYKPLKKISKLNLLQFSSIEIIGRTKFIKENGICFNKRIGLGTPYQATEEVNFLIDAWQKGARFKYIQKPFVKHTCNFQNRVLATDNIFLVRGATASRMGLLGVLLIVRWTLRYFLHYRKLSYISKMFKGFCVGYDGFNRYVDKQKVVK